MSIDLAKERKRRAFLRDPKVALLDIPTIAAGAAAGTVSHDDLAKAIKGAQAEYRAKRRDRRDRMEC